ncbi:DUF982 domain-containing protein [Aureimonas frigidaquae]|uniref:DUF982 domain-containing protein n=1 Tax=Aureimonas frigidaquae TaxID=424757 RepID=A0A0P0Z496_9HYPH|nr:DUF982 domain-containing protein [Aureimonas frigidaquae]BAT28639.1 hypothetical protein [Aureimonas frigidaquae]
MQKDAFREPVTVLVGIGIPVDVASVRDAFELMLDWPYRRRRIGHNACMNTCRKVLNGRGTVTEAREAFIAFADEAGILVPRIDEAMMAQSLSQPRITA